MNNFGSAAQMRQEQKTVAAAGGPAAPPVTNKVERFVDDLQTRALPVGQRTLASGISGAGGSSKLG